MTEVWKGEQEPQFCRKPSQTGLIVQGGNETAHSLTTLTSCQGTPVKISLKTAFQRESSVDLKGFQEKACAFKTRNC